MRIWHVLFKFTIATAAGLWRNVNVGGLKRPRFGLNVNVNSHALIEIKKGIIQLACIMIKHVVVQVF